MKIVTEQLGENTVRITQVSEVDWRQAMRDIITLLAHDDHTIDDELYEAFLGDNYAGCTSCRAALVARATLDDKPYPPVPDYFKPEKDETSHDA